MRIAVCVKHVGLLGDEIELIDDDRAVDPDFLGRALNAWDRGAVAEALALRDTDGGEVLVLTAGDAEADGALRAGLAMGADRAVRVEAGDRATADPLATARLLGAALAAESPDLVLCGVQSSDLAHGATGSAIAGLLDLPVATVVTALRCAGGVATVRRELEGRLTEVVDVDLPAVLTLQSAIEPEPVSLQATHKAQVQEIGVVQPVGDTASGARTRVLTLVEHTPGETIPGDAAAIARQVHDIVRTALAG